MTVHSPSKVVQDKSGMKEENDGERKKIQDQKGWQGDRKNIQHLQHAIIDGVSNNIRLTRYDAHIFRLNLSLQRKTEEVKKKEPKKHYDTCIVSKKTTTKKKAKICYRKKKGESFTHICQPENRKSKNKIVTIKQFLFQTDSSK